MPKHEHDSLYFSYINTFFDAPCNEDGSHSYSSAVAETILNAAKEENPTFADAYLELGKRAIERRDYSAALSVYEEMQCNIPENRDAFLGRLKSLLLLEKFEDAELVYTTHKKEFSSEVLNFDGALDLMASTIFTERFASLKHSDFDKLFFINKLLQDNVQFLASISDIFVEKLHYAYVALGHKYVTDRGGKFSYMSLDNVFMVKNKSETEKKILEKRLWDGMSKRIPWLKSCPEHVERMHEDLPHFSKSYIEQIFSAPNHNVLGTRVVLQEYASKYVNVVDNIRKTEHNPSEFDNKLCMIGASDVFGFGCEDNHTIASFLQNNLLDRDLSKPYKVENHGLRGNPLPVCLNNLFQLHINPGDVVVLFGYPKVDPDHPRMQHIDTMHCDFSRPHDFGELFFDHSHVGWKGNRLIADQMYTHLFEREQNEALPVVYAANDDELLLAGTSVELIKYLLYKKSSEICEAGELKCYIDHIKEHKKDLHGTIGSVAVNCNPMTLGHQHLLEYAASQVDHLFVFVIEEDLSFFPFKDRLKLVTEGTEHLENVTVLRGGKYICTEFTYPEYFSKDDVVEVVADASMEAWFFCEYIAKALGISVIFLGDEPTCKVTQQYNAKMSEILPDYGIKVDIIERINRNGRAVSASSVRKYLEAGDFDSIDKIVPACTYHYLIETYGNASVQAVSNDCA